MAKPESLRHWTAAYLRTLEAATYRAWHRHSDEVCFSIAEVKLLAALLERDLDPSQQVPIGHYDLDFYFPAQRLCVEVDGRQHDSVDRRERDRKRDDWLLAREGIRTLRLRAGSIDANLTAAVQAVVDQLRVAVEVAP